MKTKEQFLDRWEAALQTILFAGFFYDDKDAAMRYRKMQTEAKILRARLEQIYEEFQPTNGPPATTPSRQLGQNRTT